MAEFKISNHAVLSELEFKYAWRCASVGQCCKCGPSGPTPSKHKMTCRRQGMQFSSSNWSAGVQMNQVLVLVQ